MKRIPPRRYFWSGLIALFLLSLVTPSCGPVHSYWGVGSEYHSDGYYHHKHHKPKYYKHYYKHHKHHHHDDDDDD